MNKITPILIGGLLLIGTAACSDNVAKTSDQAPDQANQTTQAPDANKAQDIHKDGTSQVRRDQLNSDIRAREQRSDTTGKVSDDDIKSKVRSKLEANLPDSQLSVDSKDGIVTVGGTVPSQPQLARIEPLVKEINGVKGVQVNVNVVQAKPKS
jgi:osmotically-inducible protein OsmY